MDNNSLVHTKWECKYHLVFAPKYRRQVIYKDIKADVGQILGMILSILVDTFSSRISLTMPPSPKPHNTACVLS